MEEKNSLPSAFKKPFFAFKNLVSVIGLLFLLLGLPIATYLTLNQTNFLPQAVKINQPASPQAGLILETAKPTVASGDIFSVSVLVRSDIDEANLFVSKIKFPANLLNVERIEFEDTKALADEEIIPVRVIESSFDNQNGKISLVGSIPNPGFKTMNNQKKSILAKIVFKSKINGVANLTFDLSSAIFRNTDNNDILQTRQPLDINIVGGRVVSSMAPPPIQQATAEAGLIVLSPNGGEVYEYSKPLEIKWLGENIKDISISLILNNIFLGSLTPNLPNNGTYLWTPEEALPLSFITPFNTYQIRLNAKTLDNKDVVDESNGPFGIVLKKQPKLISTLSGEERVVTSVEQAADFNRDGKIDFLDLSMLMSHYNKVLEEKDIKFDLNHDGGVNDIDLWYLMNFLIKNSIIKV